MTTELYGPAFFAGRSPNVVASAAVVAPIVAELVQPRSVLDLGCGQGEWLQPFYDAGLAVAGVDIYPPDQPWAMRHDLTEPLYLGRQFDLVICLEVAEHLPASAEETLLRTIASHGDTVMFSAAVPGQEGTGHINLRPHEHWHECFQAYRYEVADVIRPRIVNDSRVSPWYRNNTYLYRRWFQ